ncbi:uncharacterized protein DUF4440 [Stella humosa]|uniref:Uncharacterized protein DUF4440 n=1 Tax=Stella humosa TaxID=94 RepID=A0A3N1KZ72_9PROT|nr:nuclear transport factor 2 family protein [Stella humosa]ROP83486.1 uncharacterized protein DUF4440 [Stella humosa]BBK33241.1 hypothetical protein STHU_38750 [Stella humosa]
MIGRRSLVAAAIAAALALGGCTTPAVEGGAGEEALHDRLLALETGSWGYVRDRDQAAMRAFVADDVLLIFGDGSRYDKEQYVASLADQTLSDLRIWNSRVIPITPDVATLTYRVRYTSAVKQAKPEIVRAEVTSTYVRRGGQWMSVIYQETPFK